MSGVYVLRTRRFGQHFLARNIPEYDSRVDDWIIDSCFPVDGRFLEGFADLKPGEIVELTFAECEGRR